MALIGENGYDLENSDLFIDSSDFSPTVVKIENASQAYNLGSFYQRIGLIVCYTCRLSVQASASGEVKVKASLPFSTNWASSSTLVGICIVQHGGGELVYGKAHLNPSSTATDVLLTYDALDTTVSMLSVTFQYGIF